MATSTCGPPLPEPAPDAVTACHVDTEHPPMLLPGGCSMPPLVTAPSSVTAGVILCALLDAIPPPQNCGLVLVHGRGASRDEQLQGQQQPGGGSAVKHGIKLRARQCVLSAWLCDVHSNLVAACIPLCSAAASQLQQWGCPTCNRRGALCYCTVHDNV
jgi:hypothetical protein